MNCTEMMELISLYIDDMLDEHTASLLKHHLEECELCRAEYEELSLIKGMCGELPMVDLPKNFEMNLHEKLLQAQNEETSNVANFSEATAKKRRKGQINWKIYTSIAAIFAILIISASMKGLMINKYFGSEKMEIGSADMNQMPGVPAETKMSIQPTAENRGAAVEEDRSNSFKMADSSMEKESYGLERQNTDSNRKVIKNAYIDLNIEDYDEKFDLIAKIAFDSGGFVENSNTQYKQYNEQNPEDSLKIGSLLIRIPENRFLETVEQIKAMGVVTNVGMGGQDITKEYRDTVNEVENLKVQEKRLREIMEKATEVKDILEVERELSRVRGDINRMSGNIQRWDELVNLSTIHVNLNEIWPKDKVIQPLRDNVLEKAKKGFIKTINDMIEWLESLFIGIASILPILLVILVIGLPCGWILLRRYKQRNNKNSQ